MGLCDPPPRHHPQIKEIGVRALFGLGLTDERFALGFEVCSFLFWKSVLHFIFTLEIQFIRLEIWFWFWKFSLSIS